MVAAAACQPRAEIPVAMRKVLSIGTWYPQDVAGSAVIDMAAENEKMVGKAVQVFDRFRIDRLGRRQWRYQPLRPARDHAGQVEMGGKRRAAGQDKGIERRQLSIKRVDLGL